MKILYCTLALLALGMVGCKPCKNACQTQCAAQPTQSQAISKAIANTSWTPIFLKNQGAAKCPQFSDKDGEFVFIHFNPDGRINGMSGDNLFGGDCKIDANGDAKFSKMFSTRRAGPYGEYEQKFLTAVSETNKITMEGDSLVFSKSGDSLLKFKQIKNQKK